MQTATLRIIQILLVTIGATATMGTEHCAAQGLERQLMGNWKIDVGESKKLGKESADEFSKLGEFDISVQFDFRRQGVLAMRVLGTGSDSNDDLGKWSVIKEDTRKKTLTIEIKTKAAKSKVSLYFIDPKQIRATTAKDGTDVYTPPFVLRRVVSSDEK